MQREGQTKYQTYVFQKQTRSRTQEFHRRYPHPYTACPFNLSVLELLRHSRPMEAPGIPETAGSNFIQAHTLCFQRLQPWEHFLDSVPLVPGTRLAGDSPPCSQVGVLEMFGLHGTGCILLPSIITYQSQIHNKTQPEKILRRKLY